MTAEVLVVTRRGPIQYRRTERVQLFDPIENRLGERIPACELKAGHVILAVGRVEAVADVECR